MKSTTPLLLMLVGSLVSVNAFADTPIVEAVKTACQRRVDIGLFKGVAIGSIAPVTPPGPAVENTILCGEAKSEYEIYELGSISKTFAGIILAKFANQGLLDLDQPISINLSELQGFDSGKITLRQLATHTSGLAREYSGSESAWLIDEPGLIEFLEKSNSLQFPVASYHYSNVGFGTIALILSRVSQQSFQQLVQTEILDPLGMGETGFMTTPTKPELLQGYDVLLNLSQYHQVSDLWAAAGGLTSDLYDMMIYLRANMHPDTSELGSAMTKSHDEGLGWDSKPGELPTWKNEAMTDGFSTVIEFDPTKNLGTVVLGNEFSGPSMITIGSVAMGGEDTSTQLELSPDFQKAVSGKYVTDDGQFEADFFPTHQYFLGAQIPFHNGSLSIRLLSLVGETMKFSVDNGSDSADRVLFVVDPLSQEMTLTYLEYKNNDEAGTPVYNSTVFRQKN